MPISRRAGLRLLAAAVCLAVLPAWPARAGEPVTVFAAASLTDAFERVGALYEERTGRPIRFSFAASSTLARQIEAGAPAQIFASANERWMDYLADAALIEADSRVSPIGNRLVLIAPTDTPLDEVAVEPSLDLAGLIEDGERIAIGDPDHVPAGLYARDALESLGLWGEAEGLLARTADVRAALALVETGEAPLGIVYATDAAASDRVKVIGRFPADSHAPITYPFAVIAGRAGTEVEAVFEFLLGPDAAAVFEDAGFAVR
jgi:molybdate transport system substrate-binding protein